MIITQGVCPLLVELDVWTEHISYAISSSNRGVLCHLVNEKLSTCSNRGVICNLVHES